MDDGAQWVICEPNADRAPMLGCGPAGRGLESPLIAVEPAGDRRPRPGTRWVPQVLKPAGRYGMPQQLEAGVCSDFARLERLLPYRRTAMVRKGSPVRVRQRASALRRGLRVSVAVR